MQPFHAQYLKGLGRTLLPAGPLWLLALANTYKTVQRLEFLHGFVRVVDERESGSLATAIMRAQTEDGDLILIRLVEIGELLAEFFFGDVGAARMQDVTVVPEEKKTVRRSISRLQKQLRIPVFQVSSAEKDENRLWITRRLTQPSASCSEAHCGGTCESARLPERQPCLRGCAEDKNLPQQLRADDRW